MNLDDWNALSAGQRDERKQHWIPRVTPGQQPIPEEIEWQGLVMEAAQRLTAEHGDLPEILQVGSSCWFSDQNPVAVIVRTRLSGGQRLSALPETYLSFPVEQEPVGDEVAAFNRTWYAVLSRLFHWPDDAIRDWSSGMEWVFRDRFFLHDSPCEYIPLILLARSAVGPRDESELRSIGKELNHAIGGRFYVDQEPDYDWAKARERIADIIRKYPSREHPTR